MLRPISYLKFRWYNDWSLQLEDAKVAWTIDKKQTFSALRGRGVKVSEEGLHRLIRLVKR